MRLGWGRELFRHHPRKRKRGWQEHEGKLTPAIPRDISGWQDRPKSQKALQVGLFATGTEKQVLVQGLIFWFRKFIASRVLQVIWKLLFALKHLEAPGWSSWPFWIHNSSCITVTTLPTVQSHMPHPDNPCCLCGEVILWSALKPPQGTQLGRPDCQTWP